MDGWMKGRKKIIAIFLPLYPTVHWQKKSSLSRCRVNKRRKKMRQMKMKRSAQRGNLPHRFLVYKGQGSSSQPTRLMEQGPSVKKKNYRHRYCGRYWTRSGLFIATIVASIRFGAVGEEKSSTATEAYPISPFSNII